MSAKLLFVALALCCLSCDRNVNPGKEKEEEKPAETVPAFTKGADISWVTEMEASGHKFADAAGNETDCFVLMKDLGLDAVRLRVWVNPSAHGNWCDTKDLVGKAERAAALGMNVMVDFHYSDWWADPGQQHKPASWKGLSFAALKAAFEEHTLSVLKALKQAGVSPAWVQIGNEIRPGMLWDEDASLSAASYDVRECDVKDSGSSSTKVKYRKNLDNLAAFVSAGYAAVKSVFPQSKVIVHLDNGYDNQLFSWFFDELKSRGGKWDMIGLSVYPYWSRNEVPQNQIINRTIENINALCVKYGCEAMIVETGVECADDKGQLAEDKVLEEGRDWLAALIKAASENTSGRCKGVFYWEPECKPGQYRLGAFTSDGRPTVIMDAFKY